MPGRRQRRRPAACVQQTAKRAVDISGSCHGPTLPLTAVDPRAECTKEALLGSFVLGGGF